MLNKKGLTVTIVFEASSANYGESIGNVSSLKKISRNDGETYTYISRQAIRYNIINQMGVDTTKIGLDGSVLQFDKNALIDENPEIDLFGYMKTVKPAKTRSAVVRLSNEISLEPYLGDLDFLTNKGLLDRYNSQNPENLKDGGNIGQSEIHSSLYEYTVTVDLDLVGIDKNDDIEIEHSEKARRICLLLDTLRYLYRDIKGRREDLKPIFAIGGLYDIKNPIFQNAISYEDGNINVDSLLDLLPNEKYGKTVVGINSGKFKNENSIQEKLNAVTVSKMFDTLKDEVNRYYESN